MTRKHLRRKLQHSIKHGAAVEDRNGEQFAVKYTPKYLMIYRQRWVVIPNQTFAESRAGFVSMSGKGFATIVKLLDFVEWA